MAPPPAVLGELGTLDALGVTLPGIASPISGGAPPHFRHSILGEGLFRDTLARERKLTDRSGRPFAVLLIDRGRGPSQGSHWAPILRTIAAVKRDIDLVGWLEQGVVLGLLLPQTPGTGALEALARLRNQIASRAGELALAAVSVRAYAHGDGSLPAGGSLPAVDLLIDGFARRWSHPWRDGAKRTLDVIGSVALMALLAPLFTLVLFAVKCTSPGPALYRQVRVGHRGRSFTMLKFRSMYVNSGHRIHQDYVSWFIRSSGQLTGSGEQVFKLTRDPRITPVGRFLRKSSLDELPQFWNVLRGEMSLVGPRPPLPFEVEQYQPWHRQRVLEAKPGITGPWQVCGRSRTTFDEMVRLDLRYARTHSLWTDIKILAATPWAVLSGRGAC